MAQSSVVISVQPSVPLSQQQVAPSAATGSNAQLSAGASQTPIPNQAPFYQGSAPASTISIQPQYGEQLPTGKPKPSVQLGVTHMNPVAILLSPTRSMNSVGPGQADYGIVASSSNSSGPNSNPNVATQPTLSMDVTAAPLQGNLATVHAQQYGTTYSGDSTLSAVRPDMSESHGAVPPANYTNAMTTSAQVDMANYSGYVRVMPGNPTSSLMLPQQDVTGTLAGTAATLTAHSAPKKKPSASVAQALRAREALMEQLAKLEQEIRTAETEGVGELDLDEHAEVEGSIQSHPSISLPTNSEAYSHIPMYQSPPQAYQYPSEQFSDTIGGSRQLYTQMQSASQPQSQSQAQLQLLPAQSQQPQLQPPLQLPLGSQPPLQAAVATQQPPTVHSTVPQSQVLQVTPEQDLESQQGQLPASHVQNYNQL